MKNKIRDIEIKEQIDRYVNGQLTEEEIEKLWPRLIQDQEYMDYLETSANLKAIADRQQKSETEVHRKAWVYTAAAAVLLLMAVLASMRMGFFDSSAKVQPVETIELDYYRSTETVPSTNDKERVIRNALKLSTSGKFDEAVSLLNTARNKATDASWIAKLDITLGTLFYNEDKFNDAAYYFKDVVKYKDEVNVLTLEKAYWYLGNSYFQMNMLQEAEEVMQKTYALNGAYSRVAKSYLDAMKDAMDNQS